MESSSMCITVPDKQEHMKGDSDTLNVSNINKVK